MFPEIVQDNIMATNARMIFFIRAFVAKHF